MRSILLILSIFISSCSCPECFDISAQVRIIYLNIEGDNLLANNQVKPVEVKFCIGEGIPFGIKDYVVSGSSEKFHIEFANEELHERCESKQCCIFIEFESGIIDTLYYQIKESSSGCCTSYNVSEFSYNGVNYLGKTENTIGAYEVIKE